MYIIYHIKHTFASKISANNLLDEASRLTTEANKAIDYANQLDQMATEAL